MRAGLKSPMEAMRGVRVVPLLALLLAALLLAGCSNTSFYWQATSGHFSILNKRRPIEKVLQDPATPADTARKLRLIQQVQAFAALELALPERGHYRYYADLGRPYVSWLVVAAQPLALEEHSFCYLIVGCLGYKGFFDKEDARLEMEALRKTGLDVMMRPVTAYSTLGWFDDPVLNTFIRGSDIGLISTVIHELAHQVVFLPGETAFNESFAATVEEEGVRRFLAGDAEKAAMLAEYEAGEADSARFNAILVAGRKKLEALYAATLDGEEMRARKEEVFESMREAYRAERNSFKVYHYESWFERPLNNAHMVGVGHYAEHVPAFRALLRQSGGDFPRFYEAVIALGGLEPEKRAERLKELARAAMAAR